jgi:hypothetical protein
VIEALAVQSFVKICRTSGIEHAADLFVALGGGWWKRSPHPPHENQISRNGPAS